MDHMSQTESHQTDQAEIARRIAASAARFAEGTKDGLWIRPTSAGPIVEQGPGVYTRQHY